MILLLLFSAVLAQADFRPLPYECIEPAIRGSQSGECALNHDNILCVGLQRALANATSCLELQKPAIFGCKRYGTPEHSQDEWMAAAKKRHLALAACLNGLSFLAPYKDDDGGSSLEYRNGDIVAFTVAGHDLFEIVSYSPFAMKLSITQLAAIQSAMTDWKEVLGAIEAKAKEQNSLPSGSSLPKLQQ